MKKLLIGLLILGSFSSYASELKEFCKDDPTGELYSEIIDSDVIDGFESINLNPSSYQSLIDNNPELGLFDLAEKTKQTHPEIANALEIWKLKTFKTNKVGAISASSREHKMLHTVWELCIMGWRVV